MVLEWNVCSREMWFLEWRTASVWVLAGFGTRGRGNWTCWDLTIIVVWKPVTFEDSEADILQ